MSVVTLFTSKAPTLGGVEFDAVLEDTFEGSVDQTTFPIESGANATDHRIIQPFRWSLVGVVSNNPLRVSATDFIGVLSTFGDGVLATTAGLSAGFLSGSDDTRAGSALEFLIGLLSSKESFAIDAGDIQLSNMAVVDLRRVKVPANEGGLVFEAQLQELTELDTLLASGNPTQSQLREGDPSQSQAAETINKGEQGLRGVTTSDSLAVGEVIA